MLVRRLTHGWAAAIWLIVLCLGVPRPAIATAPPLSGRSPDALIDAANQGLFRVDPRASGLTTQVESGTWRIPVILVSFADDTLRYTAQDFERLLLAAQRLGNAAEVCNGPR